VTAVTKIKDISVAFSITENQIETQTKPDVGTFLFDFNIFDSQDRPAYNPLGHCADNSAHPGRNCLGNKKDSNPPTTEMCGGECVGAVKNKDFDPITAGKPSLTSNFPIECWAADLCLVGEAILATVILGPVGIAVALLIDGKDFLSLLFGSFSFDFNKDLADALRASAPDPFCANLIKPDTQPAEQSGFVTITPGPIDVTIQDDGLTAAMGAEIATKSVDPDVPVTPGPSLTTASTPTVTQAIAFGDDVTMLVADDVFNQVFASMKEAGLLKSICTSGDNLSVDKLLPADCDAFGPANDLGAELRGICHAIRGDDCLALASDSSNLAIKKGACVGFSGGNCNTFLPLHANASPAAYAICIVTPHRNIHTTDKVFLCARVDLDPEFLVKADTTADPTVDTDLTLDKLSVVFGIDRGGDGYTGKLEDLTPCWSQEGDAAADCRYGAACADLDLKSQMVIDNITKMCAPNQVGFAFHLLQVLPQSLDLGVLCNGGPPLNDKGLLGNAIESIVTKAVADHSEKFLPPQCMNGFDLCGKLIFDTSQAKLFGLTTSGASDAGFADYVGITIPLQAPPP
jgi:hypothetical protein